MSFNGEPSAVITRLTADNTDRCDRHGFKLLDGENGRDANDCVLLCLVPSAKLCLALDLAMSHDHNGYNTT
eukprot:scaffold102600_cov36-Cyclotella_meneghiniana.AAC.1